MFRPIRRHVPALALCLMLAAPVAADAADAQSRFVGLTLSGQQSAAPQTVGISPDGDEVLQNVEVNRGVAPTLAAIRNLTNNTTELVLPIATSADGVSSDLQRILFHTKERLDPADTNDFFDSYVYDRRTGASTLVDRSPTTGQAEGQELWSPSAYLSGDGNAVFYDNIDPLPLGTYRYDIAAGTVSKVSSAQLFEQQFDDAGRVVATRDGIVVGDRVFPDPTGPNSINGGYHTAPDGSAVVVTNAIGGLWVVDATVGTWTSVTVPAVLQNGFSVLRAENGGHSIIVSYRTAPAYGTSRNTVGRFEIASGAVTPIGGDTPGASHVTAITRDNAFVASDLYVSALGSKPIPGVAEPIPPVNAAEFLRFYPGCSYGTWYAGTVKAALSLLDVAWGVNPRQPTKALVKVIQGGKIVNQFTLAAPRAKTNITPATGGFTYSTTVTYSDGSTSTGLRTIAPYTPVKNDTQLFSASPGACQSLNR